MRLGVTAEFNATCWCGSSGSWARSFAPGCSGIAPCWNERESRIEMHLESLVTQEVAIPALDLQVPFRRGESIHTENSYKFTPDRVGEMLGRAGFCGAEGVERREEVVWGVSGGSGGEQSLGIRV